MLPLHIQIISLKDCLMLRNISIWKCLRIIEKYEKHSLTVSKYSRHFRHSLVFKNRIPRTYIRFPTFYGNRSFSYGKHGTKKSVRDIQTTRLPKDRNFKSALQTSVMLHGVNKPNTTPIGQDRKFRDLRVLL